MVYCTEMYSDSCQTSKMELFAKLTNNWNVLTFFSKNSNLKTFGKVVNTPQPSKK